MLGLARAMRDDVDLPFVDDPSVVGVWRSVAYVGTPEEFVPEDGPRDGLFLKEQAFLPGGKTPDPAQTWTRGVLLDQSEKTASHYSFQDRAGVRYMFLEWKSGDYTLRNRKPGIYVLVRDADLARLPRPATSEAAIDGAADRLLPLPPSGRAAHPAASSLPARQLTALPHHDPASAQSWQVDLRGQDLSRLNLEGRVADLMRADFDSKTRFPRALPAAFDPERILELGRNPGLGVRRLHAAGITGKGVSIAIIDQALLVDHREYDRRLRSYDEVHWRPSAATMHAGAVASIAVGKDCGVAPGADLYFVANDFSDGRSGVNFVHLARAIDRVLAIDAALPEASKIRVLAIARGFAPPDKGYREVTSAVARARAAGLFVVTSSLSEQYGFHFHGLGREPLAPPDEKTSYGPGLWWQDEFFAGRGVSSPTLLVPMDSRTTASEAGAADFVFYRDGGWSWCIPYLAGLYALACQVRPDVTPDLFWKAALETGDRVTVEHAGRQHRLERVVDPPRLIDALRRR